MEDLLLAAWTQGRTWARRRRAWKSAMWIVSWRRQPVAVEDIFVGLNKVRADEAYEEFAA